MMRQKIFFILLSFFLLPNLALADGIFVPPYNHHVYETSQKAVLFYEKSTKNETMILSVNYTGDTSKFGWVIPTPSKPEVKKGNNELFISLDKLTTPYYGTMGMEYSTKPIMSDTQQQNGIVVYADKQIEYYQVKVIQAESLKDLTTWFGENNFYFPEKEGYLFNSYIENKWFFTVVSLSNSDSDLAAMHLETGTATPLSLTFQTEKIVFPLKISSIASTIYQDYKYNSNPSGVGPGRVDVLLYVFSEHRQTSNQNFSVDYASHIDKDKIEKLAFDDNGQSLITPIEDKYFLTKMYKSYALSEMTSDVYLYDDVNDDYVNATELKPVNNSKVAVVIIFSISGLIVILVCLSLLLKSKNDRK